MASSEYNVNGQLKIVTLGSAPSSIDPGATDGVDVQLSSSNQQVVKDNSPLQVKATAAVQDAAGNTATVTQTFTLRAP